MLLIRDGRGTLLIGTEEGTLLIRERHKRRRTLLLPNRNVPFSPQ